MTKTIKKSLALILSIVMMLSVVPMGMSFATGAEDFAYEVSGETIKLDKYHGKATTVVIPDTIDGLPVTVIGGEAFRSLDVVDVAVGENVVTIGRNAFKNCIKLETIYISKSVKNINNSAFNNCPALVTVNYAGTQEEWASIAVATGNDILANCNITYDFCRHALSKVEAVAAECEKAGNVEYWACAKCEKNFADEAATQELSDVVISALEHNYVLHEEESIAPECDKEGLDFYVCELCGGTKEDVLEKLGHTEETLQEAVAPTCTEKGYTAHIVCSVCEAVISERTEVPANGHAEEIIPAIAATCEEPGSTAGKYCTVCGEITVKTEPVNALGHDEEIIAAVEATCTETGLTEGKKCLRCKEITLQQTVVEALDHTVVIDAAVPATCTATGLTEGSHCSVCNVVITAQTVTDALGHTEATLPAVDATCTETGLTEGAKCSTCNVILVPQETVPMIDHAYGEIEITKEPTCTVKGESEQICTECGFVLVAEVATIPHIEGQAPSKEPTCLEPGYNGTRWCTVCNTYLEDKVDIPALGHNFVKDETKSYAASCTIDGRDYAACSRCNAVEDKILPKLGHDLNEFEGKAATCTEAGFKAYATCNRCDLNTYEVIPALGHTAGAAATCTTPQTCKTCGSTLIDALGHTEITLNAVDPDCETTGLTEGKVCATCNVVLAKQETVPALGHNYEADAERSYAATCVDAGLKVEVCTRENCSSEIIDPISALGHDLDTFEGKDATCTEAGFKAYEVCKRCDHNTYEVIPALGHTAGAAATCTTAQTCTVCGKVIVDALGHKEVILKGMPATCTEHGKTDGAKCSVCNEIITPQETILALGHKEVILEGKAATCTEDGLTKGKKCDRCKAVLVEQVTIISKGHVEKAVEAVEPTCEKEGSTAGVVCENCDYVFDKVMPVEKLGHNYIVVSGTEATCTEDGLTEGVACTRCGDEKTPQEVIPALGHAIEEIKAVAPTCTEDGLTAGEKCKVCGIVTKEPEVAPAKGHTAGSAATCTQDQTCTDCDYVFAEATGHTPGAAATCTTAQLCTVCDGVVTDALGHDLDIDRKTDCLTTGYEKAKCKRCNYAYSIELPATGHHIENWTPINIPTCKTEGNSLGLCLNCKYEISRIEPKVDHKDTNADKKCDFCGVSLVTPEKPEEDDKEDDKPIEDGKCTCRCHAYGIRGLIYDLILMIQRIFGLNKTCRCGEAHY